MIADPSKPPSEDKANISQIERLRQKARGAILADTKGG
jgi:hypothetical protein